MTKEALKLALEALEQVHDANIVGLTLTQDYYDAITAIKETLAHPAWIGLTKEEFIYFSSCCHFEVVDEIEKLLQRKNT
jgi:hypothetical protein